LQSSNVREKHFVNLTIYGSERSSLYIDSTQCERGSYRGSISDVLKKRDTYVN